MLLVIALVGIEATLIGAAFVAISGPGHAISAPKLPAIDAGDQVTEVSVLEARLVNERDGIGYVYDVQIWVQVPATHATRVRREVDQYGNEIHAAIASIWRAAEPHEIEEPDLATLNRRVYELLAVRFNRDGQRGAVLGKCIVLMSVGYRVD